MPHMLHPFLRKLVCDQFSFIHLILTVFINCTIMAVYYGFVDRDHPHPLTSLRRSLKFSYLIRLNFSENF